MARKINVTLSGDAEKLVKQLTDQGLSEEEIIAKALTLLNMASKSQLQHISAEGKATQLKVSE